MATLRQTAEKIIDKYSSVDKIFRKITLHYKGEKYIVSIDIKKKTNERKKA